MLKLIRMLAPCLLAMACVYPSTIADKNASNSDSQVESSMTDSTPHATPSKDSYLVVKSPHIVRTFQVSGDSIRTLEYKGLPENVDLLASQPLAGEGTITIGDMKYALGSPNIPSFRFTGSSTSPLDSGGERLELSFASPPELPAGLKIKVVYEAHGAIPLITKQIRIENNGPEAVLLNGIQLEAFTPAVNNQRTLMLEDDYVRDGLTTAAGKRVKSPWIEEQPKYVDYLLGTLNEPVKYAYPVVIDQWISVGASFQSFTAYQFAITNDTPERRGLEYRTATRKLFPLTTRTWLGCLIAPSKNVEDYYKAIELAAEVGYETVSLQHGWIDGKLTHPVFSTYADYEPNPELFPNGWDDVKKLTDFAHSKGVAIGMYLIYVSIWDDKESKAVADNQWHLIWAKDDNSARWGTTLCPGTDWGPYVNRKIEDALVRGGFDGYDLDGPYYGDISVAEGRPYKPGGPNQPLAWERNVSLYERMRALGRYSCAAQSFAAFPHGLGRIGTTGYDEGDFGRLGMWSQILATRSGAYKFTQVYRSEQSNFFIPCVSWLDGPDLEPMEENVPEYNAYLANCFGYGFDGRPFQHLPYDGPKSKAAVLRWINFWKSHKDFFKQGHVLHVRKPDGKQIDAIMHVITEGDGPKRALVVAFNPDEKAQTDELTLPFDVVDWPAEGWKAMGEDGAAALVVGNKITVTIPARDATWWELDLK